MSYLFSQYVRSCSKHQVSASPRIQRPNQVVHTPLPEPRLAFFRRHPFMESDSDDERESGSEDDVRHRLLLADDADSHFQLGVAYLEGGHGLSVSHDEAVRRLRMAMDMGHPRAPRMLGYIKYTGMYGFPQRLDEALRLFLKSAELGDATAKYYVARMYHKGEGVEKNLETAASYYKQASIGQNPNPDAQFKMGVFYSRGLGGLTQNKATAVYWYNLAAKQGHAKALKRLQEREVMATGILPSGCMPCRQPVDAELSRKRKRPWNDKPMKHVSGFPPAAGDILRGDESKLVGTRVTVVNSRDVLFGRGRSLQEHTGNKAFRDIVAGYRSEFRAKKSNKGLIISYIIESVRRRGGRFLVRARDNSWRVATTQKAWVMVSHDLHVRAAEEESLLRRSKCQSFGPVVKGST